MKKISKILMNHHQPSKIIYDNGDVEESKCLKCKNKKCIFYSLEEICSDKAQIPINIDKNICPVSAIYSKGGEVIIDKTKCIKCGLCASRCINKSIYANDDNYPTVNKGDCEKSENDFKNVIIEGEYLIENDDIINSIYSDIKSKNIDPNIIGRNLLIQCGIKSVLSRKGDVNLRMDSLIVSEDRLGVCEIEFGNDVLSCPRCLLDDIAVMCSRYNCNIEDLLALVVALGLPNNRTDFWRVIKDIKDITDIEIQTITIGALLILMWNNKKLNIKDNDYYLDCDNNSLKEKISIALNRKVVILNDVNSALDTIK